MGPTNRRTDGRTPDHYTDAAACYASSVCEWSTCSDELSVALVLGLDEVRQDVLVRPADGAAVGPVVVVVPTTSQVLHVVEVTRAAQTATQRPVALLPTAAERCDEHVCLCVRPHA